MVNYNKKKLNYIFLFLLIVINFFNSYSICIKRITNLSNLNLRVRKVDFKQQEHISSEIANIFAAKLDQDIIITPAILNTNINVDTVALINYGLSDSESRVEKPELKLKKVLRCDFIVYIQHASHQQITNSFRFYKIHNHHYNTDIFGVYANHFERNYDQSDYNFEIENLIKDKEEDVEIVFYLDDNKILKIEFNKFK